MRKPILTIAILTLMAFVLSACAAGSDADTTTSSAPASGDVSNGAAITIEDFAFSGATSVDAGTTVTATNQDGVTHTWTSDDDAWDSGPIASGESFEFTFEEPGDYPYFCRIHPTMEGTITVEG